jgi:hypothetical protein
MTSTKLTSDEIYKAKLGLAAGQTAYALNNSGKIEIGQPLRYIDDAANLQNPGAKPLNLGFPDGFVVRIPTKTPRRAQMRFWLTIRTPNNSLLVLRVQMESPLTNRIQSQTSS